MSDMLDRILETKRAEVTERKRTVSLAALGEKAMAQTPPRGFRAALDARAATGYGLIAEVKKASPSKGLIRADFDPAAHALAYQDGGAACLSVLTDAPWFEGHEDYFFDDFHFSPEGAAALGAIVGEDIKMRLPSCAQKQVGNEASSRQGAGG